MSAEDVAELDRLARKLLGKSLAECTRDDVEAVVQDLLARAGRWSAETDQANAAIRDVEACGCAVETPVLPDGTRDIGRARPRHTCGRTS